jgi:hypothetical protein
LPAERFLQVKDGRRNHLEGGLWKLTGQLDLTVNTAAKGRGKTRPTGISLNTNLYVFMVDGVVHSSELLEGDFDKVTICRIKP